MEESKKTWNDQEKKKMVIKIGGIGGGGGIGAVILLGGVFAAAAFASAFVVRGKGRSSGKDRRSRHQNPPPENNKQSEQDEGNKGQEFIFTDQYSLVFDQPSSKGAIKEVETYNDTEAFPVSTRSSTQDEEDRVEINGVTPGDQILCPVSPKKVEKDAISDDGFIIVDEEFPLLEGKLPLKSQNKMSEDEKTEVQLTKEEASNDHSKENENLEEVYIEEEREERAEREHSDDGKIEEENILPMIEELIPEDTGVRKEDGAKERVAESQELYENKTSTQCDAKKNVEKEFEEELISPGDIEITKDGANEEVPEEYKSSVQFVVDMPKEEEVDLERNIAEEVDESSEILNTSIATVKDGLISETSDDEEEGADKIKDFDDEPALSEETVEESSVGSGDSSSESNCDAVWPAESPKNTSMEPQQVKLINYEVGGKIQGDKTAKEGEEDSQKFVKESSFEPQNLKAEDNMHELPDGKGDVEKTFIKKNVVELGMIKDQSPNSTKRRMIIGTLSVLSSLSCSWFFGLSFAKLCLFVFLSMILSELHGY